MNPVVDPDPVFALMTRLCCVGIVLQTSEVLWNWRELCAGRLLGWSAGPRGGGFPGMLYAQPWCGRLLVVRGVLAAVGLVALPGGLALFWWLGALVMSQLYYNRRFTILAGNSETLFLVCLAAAWMGALPEASSWLRTAALGFVSMQVVLAYLAAGADKLASRGWRDGSRLLQVVRDSSYRLPGVGRWLESHPGLAVALTWGIVVLELGFPLAIFLPEPVFWTFFAGGLCFHAVNAVALGLHGFWWSMAAAYPAIWFVHVLMRTTMGQD